MKKALNKAKLSLEKELASVEKQEKRLERAALKAKPSAVKAQLISRIPAKVYLGLESAFCKGFALVFDKGRSVIELSYKRENLIVNHAVGNYAVDAKGGRRELRKINKRAARSELVNITVSGIEGIGLGALGVGMPDIVVFLSILLKGVYETALNYGFDYVSRQEQLLILKMMETSLSSGDDWLENNTRVDAMFAEGKRDISDAELQTALQACASAFAMDMLLLKFIQGLPVIGMVGGAANPVYYNRIMKYVRLKYRKYYLVKKQRNLALKEKRAKLNSIFNKLKKGT